MEAIYELIKKRTSVRNYNSQPIEKDKLQKIFNFFDENRKGPLGSEMRFEIVDTNNYDHTDLKKLGTYGFIKGPRTFIAGVVKMNENAMEDYGYCMEKNILMATSLGLGTCWLGGTFSRSTFAQKLNTVDNELLPAVTPIGYAAEKKSLTENVLRAVTGANNRKKPQDLFFQSSISTPLDLNSCGEYSKALEAVRIAPSASNKQPWRIIKGEGNTFHLFMNETPAYNNAFKGIKIQNLDMGIAMCHFELTASELGLKGNWKRTNPAIAAGDFKYIVSWIGL